MILLPSGAQFMGFSPDNKMILFSYDIKPVWRHSYTAQYLVLDTVANKANTNILYQLTHRSDVMFVYCILQVKFILTADRKFVIMCIRCHNVEFWYFYFFPDKYQGPLKSLFCRTIFSVFSTYEEEI